VPEAINGGAGSTDTFAAEFVLGTLDADERRAANQLLASDEGFADRVRLWERRLGELHLMVEPVEPASDIWQRIQARMPEVRQSTEMMEPEPEPAEPEREPEPEPEPEPQPETHAELHSEWQTETALEPEPKPQAEVEPQSPPELQTDPEREPEREESQPEASSVPEDTFESLIAALKKPAHKEEAGAESEQPIALPAAPAAEAEQLIPPEEPTAATLPAAAPAPVPAPTWHLPPEQTDEPPIAAEEPPIAPTPPFVAPAPIEEIEKGAEPVLPQSVRKAQRSLTRWRVLAVLLFIALAAIAGLVAAWRFIPDRIPPALQPVELMRLAGIPVPASQPPRKPPPPESTFEE
jgi:hypothetical protein